MRRAPLLDRTLHRHARTVSIPRYDRRRLVPAVVHLGVGSFHRAHQAVYLDELARRGHTAWGLTGVGLRRRALGDAVLPQDGLYTVLERGARGERARVVGVMGRYLFAPDGPRRVVQALADPRTRLVTLTVTGAAYCTDPVTGAFDPASRELVADLADPSSPSSALGLLVEALAVRRRTGRPPITVLSCDNLPNNGLLTQRAVTALARLRDLDLAAWIEAHVAFPSAMVDRITPRTTDADRERLGRRFGVVDRWPVVTEPFSDWVIEDAFADGRPPLDEVGARFVADIEPYALAKTRLLNGSHLVLGALGRVAGVATMAELMADATYRELAATLMDGEIAPSLGTGGPDLASYRRALLERLGNPAMQDPLARLCRAASVKLPRHVLPSLLTARAEGRPHPLLTLGVAAVIRHLRGLDERGRSFALDDPAAVRLRALARAGGPDVRPLLAETGVFGPLHEDEALVGELEAALAALERDGVRGAVAQALAAPGLVAA